MGFLIDKQHDYKLRAGDNIGPPILTATVVGGTGSTSLSYVATFGTLVGESLPTTVVTITDAPAVLTTGNYVTLAVESVPAGVTSVRYYKLDSGQYKLLGDPVTSTPWTLNDNGINTLSGSVIAPTEDTSGRPQWRAMLFHAGRYLQRQELQDLQWLLQRSNMEIGSAIHKNGDIIEGLAEQFVSGTTWSFTKGKVYLDGQHVPVDSGSVTLAGTGKEIVGLMINPTIVTSGTDAYIKNQDEGVDLAYAQPGADRLVYTISWVVDTAGQVDIREFLDNEPVFQVIRTEKTELQKEMKRRTYDTSGDYVVKPFPIKMKANDDNDPDLMTAYIYSGKAYVLGEEIETIATQKIEVPRSRDYKTVSNSYLTSFDATGGYTIGTATETFDVDGLAVKLKFGLGNSYTVTFTGNGKTAAQVAEAINTSINTGLATPISVCAASAGSVMLKAANGKSLTVETVTSHAYTVLGISTGVYYVSGTRLYNVGDNFIKDVSRLSYVAEKVETKTRNGGSNYDELEERAVTLLGVSTVSAANAWDGNYTHENTIDFQVGEENDQIDWSIGGADPAGTYYLRYQYSYTPVMRTKTRVLVTDAIMTKGAEDGSDTIQLANALGTGTEVISGSPVSSLSGNASDVVRILRVNNTAGQSVSDYSLYSLDKNTSDIPSIEFGVSKIDWGAAGAQNSGSTGQPITGATYYCTFEYWKWSTIGDYSSANTYDADYKEIEIGPNGVTELRDVVDFRRMGASGDSSLILPIHGNTPSIDFNFYLARVDKLALDSTGYFYRIPGSPDEEPPIPTNQVDSMSIAQLIIPPYTYSPGSVIIEKLEVIRKTQQSINEMQMQIDRLKYQAALLEVQRDATDNPAAANAKGIFTDSLVGFKHSDVTFSKGGIQFDAAIDSSEQCVRLPMAEAGQGATVNIGESTRVAKVGSTVVFDYTTEPYISQPKATSIINVNPNALFGWFGTCDVSPREDFWTDVNQLADIDINYDEQQNWINQQNAELAGQAVYGRWRITANPSGFGNWAHFVNRELSGQGVDFQETAHFRTTQEDNWKASFERTTSYSQLVPNRTLVEIGNNLIDKTIIPYCRTTVDGGPFYLNLIVEGVLPSTDMACSIDGVNVDLIAVSPSLDGSSTFSGKTTVASDGVGKLYAKFAMPTGIATGQKAIHVFSASDPNETYAMGTFTSQGYLETMQRSMQGIMTTTTREVVSTTQVFAYSDPLAQTFAVTSGTKWISYVKLRFQSKDPNLPVTAEIRETLNGYPTSKVIQTKTLYPADINISDDASAVTTFTFSEMVGYGPGEYCIVILCNSTAYNVWIAKMGEVNISDGTLLQAQAYDGVFFTSPNNSTWEPHSTWDLTFEIGTSNFENNAQVVFDNITGLQASAFMAGITAVMPTGCSMRWSYSTQNGATGSWKAFLPGIDTGLSSVATQVKVRCDITGTGTTFQILDSGAGIVALLSNENGNYIGTNAEFDDSCDQVVVVADIAADGVNGSGTRSVTPYYSIDDGDIWVELEPEDGFVATNVGDGTYKEYTFTTRGEVSISAATNANPIVCTSAGHGYKDNTVVLITGATGNTNVNGIRRIVNVDDDTFELVDATTGANIAGNGTFGGTCTMTVNPFDQCRIRMYLETSNRVVTPKVRKVRGICS